MTLAPPAPLLSLLSRRSREEDLTVDEEAPPRSHRVAPGGSRTEWMFGVRRDEAMAPRAVAWIARQA